VDRPEPVFLQSPPDEEGEDLVTQALFHATAQIMQAAGEGRKGSVELGRTRRRGRLANSKRRLAQFPGQVTRPNG